MGQKSPGGAPWLFRVFPCPTFLRFSSCPCPAFLPAHFPLLFCSSFVLFALFPVSSSFFKTFLQFSSYPCPAFLPAHFSLLFGSFFVLFALFPVSSSFSGLFSGSPPALARFFPCPVPRRPMPFRLRYFPA